MINAIWAKDFSVLNNRSRITIVIKRCCNQAIYRDSRNRATRSIIFPLRKLKRLSCAIELDKYIRRTQDYELKALSAHMNTHQSRSGSIEPSHTPAMILQNGYESKLADNPKGSYFGLRFYSFVQFMFDIRWIFECSRARISHINDLHNYII